MVAKPTIVVTLSPKRHSKTPSIKIQFPLIPGHPGYKELKDIVGQSKALRFACNAVYFVKYKYSPTDQPPLRSCILYGESGVGRRSLVRAVASEMGAALFEVPRGHFTSKSDQTVYDLFEQAAAYKHAVIFFEDFETLIGRGKRSHGTMLHSAFRNILEYHPKHKNVIVFGAASKLDGFSTDMLARMSKIEMVKLDGDARHLLIQRWLAKKRTDVIRDERLPPSYIYPLTFSADQMDTVVRFTSHMSGRDIEQFLENISKPIQVVEARHKELGREVKTSDFPSVSFEHVLKVLLMKHVGPDAPTKQKWWGLSCNQCGKCDRPRLQATSAGAACNKFGIDESAMYLGILKTRCCKKTMWLRELGDASTFAPITEPVVEPVAESKEEVKAKDKVKLPPSPPSSSLSSSSSQPLLTKKSKEKRRRDDQVDDKDRQEELVCKKPCITG